MAVWAGGWQGHAESLQQCDQAGQLPRMPPAGKPAERLLGASGEVLKSSCAIILLTLKHQERTRACEANLHLTLNPASSV